MGFPGGACAREVGSSPGLGRFPWSRKWQPTPVLLPGRFQGQKILAGNNPWGSQRIRHTHSSLDQLYTHLCSFQNLVLSARVNQKANSEMLTVSRFSVFSILMAFLETYIPFLLFYIESDLPMAGSCHTGLSASADHVSSLSILVCVGICP